MAKLDRADAALLEAVQRNNRLTSEELAALVNLSPTACQRRLKRLRAERNEAETQAALGALTQGAHGKANLLELAVQAARAKATVGEISDALEAALRELVSPRQITVLAAGLGPESRYRRYLDILHGSGRLVIGTRSAAYAPVANLRLAVILDDGDDNLVDPRAPYVHARASDVAPGKKEQKQEAAEKVAAGKFAPRGGPKLAVNNC